MKAQLIFSEHHDLTTNGFGGFAELVIWRVPHPVLPSEHPYKYRLVYIVDGRRVVGYDNERGKGDHKHFGESEYPYIFSNVRTLVDDFYADIERWENGYRYS